MKRIMTFFGAALVAGSLFAGGLVTNTNQSARYTRLQSRNASTGIDAVYYNPAGLTKLGNGFYLSLNNQTVGQTKSILNNYPYLNGTPKEYTGKVSAPFFPGAYAAFNAGRLSISAGFNPIGGGGGAIYENGLPSFEMGIADLVPKLASQGIPVSAYSADIFFEGKSAYFGYQLNAAYRVADWLSVAAGLRLVTASNSYNGYLKNIKINPNYPNFGAGYTGGMVLASDFFTSGATFLNGLSAGASQYASALLGIVNSGAGSVGLSNGTAAGLSAAQVTQIQQLVGAAGQSPGSLTIAQAQAVLQAAAPVFAVKASAMTANAAATQDILVDATKAGMGYTPTISVNIAAADNLNFAVRYDFQTRLELTTTVNDNKSGGIFTDGGKTIADMPAMLAAGFEYKPVNKLLVTASMNYYFDKNVDYDGSSDIIINMIDNNFQEYAFGVEYGITKKLTASAGWLGTFTGVNSNYQNDQNYSLNTNSVGAGFGIQISKMIGLNIGGQYTVYQEGTKSYTHLLGTTGVPVLETYNKNTWVVAVGLDFRFGK
jgi:hypothetical protein